MTWLRQEVDLVAERIRMWTGHTFAGTVDAAKGEGLSIAYDAERARITACDKTALARGLFLLAQAQQEGKRSLHITQRRHIASCGAFLDCSRGAVLTVDAVKRMIACHAALGLNLLVLYTEDTYEVPEYPYFGHLRGRYTANEMREMDAYAAEMGVELAPCIQTLAHLGQFLQWRDNEHLKDTQYCVMIDDEETYAFLEAEIRAMRGYVRGKRIHIGMDEAHSVGLGRYYAQHGPVDRFELLRRHLDRVVKICEKYGFEPMMWSDMFFRLGSKTNDYYDPEAHIPQAVLDNLPPVDLVYWDYYHTDENFYHKMLAEHARMGGRTVFAGGIWTWSGFLPHVDLTEATTVPALRACVQGGIDTVMATMWGDDGNETDLPLALSQLPLYSEYAWQGMDCDPDAIARMGAFLTGIPKEAYAAFALFYPGAVDDRTGKGLIYCDLLYPLLPGNPDLQARAVRFRKAQEALAPHLDRDGCRYADALFEIAAKKAALIPEIRAYYESGNREGLRRIAEQEIPPLVEAYERLTGLHRDRWEAACKRNGWETFALRYGSVIGRLWDVQHALRRYADGTLATLCELDEPALDPTRRAGMQWYEVYVSPQL